MNQAATKYANIYTAQEGKFSDSDKTITEEIVSIIDDSNHNQCTQSQSTCKYRSPANNQSSNIYQTGGSENTSPHKPTFLKHYKSSNDKTGVK